MILIIKLNNKYIPIKPTEWKNKFNITVTVGLGTGSTQQQQVMLNGILERQLQAFQLQGGKEMPMVNLKNIYNTLTKIVENSGLKNVDAYFVNPDVGKQMMQPPAPPPLTPIEKIEFTRIASEEKRKVADLELKYKELENIAKLNSTKWVPEGIPNLYAVARGKGSVFWIVRVSHNKKRSVITIGQWPAIKAETARELTPSIKILIKQGFSENAIKNAIQITLDPRKVLSIVEGQKVSGNGPTADFENVATEWYENHLSGGLSDGPYKKQVIQQLNDHVFPSLGKRPINTIKRKEIVNALRDLWMSKKPTAVKIRGNIERIFDYAIDNELRDDNPTPLPRSMPASQHQINHFVI